MNTEMCDFVKLILDRMDTNPNEFMQGSPTFRWSTLINGLIDCARGDTGSNSSRSLWALNDHEIAALTDKYRVLYLEQQKRDFLKNILGGDENQGKKLVIKRPSSSVMSMSDITAESLTVLQEGLSKQYTTGYTDPRGAYGHTLAEAIRKQIDNTNNN